MFSVLYPAFCIVMWPTMRRELDFCTLRTGTKKKRQTTRTFTRTEEEEKKNERHKRRKDWRRQKEKYNVAPQTCDFFLRRNNSEFADKDEAIDQKWKKRRHSHIKYAWYYPGVDDTFHSSSLPSSPRVNWAVRKWTWQKRYTDSSSHVAIYVVGWMAGYSRGYWMIFDAFCWTNIHRLWPMSK